jgi:hemerythrin superfamily protein
MSVSDQVDWKNMTEAQKIENLHQRLSKLADEMVTRKNFNELLAFLNTQLGDMTRTVEALKAERKVP